MTRPARVVAVVTPDGAATITLGDNVHQLQAASADDAMSTVVGLVIEEATVTGRPLELVAHDATGAVTGFYVDADGSLVEDPSVLVEPDVDADDDQGGGRGPAAGDADGATSTSRPPARGRRTVGRAALAIAGVAALVAGAIAVASVVQAGDRAEDPSANASTTAASATAPTSSEATTAPAPTTVRATSPRPRQLRLIIRGLEPGARVSVQLQPSAGERRVVDLVAEKQRLRWVGKGLVPGPLAWTVVADAQAPLVGTVRIKAPAPAPTQPQSPYTPPPRDPAPKPPSSGGGGGGPRGPIAE